MDRQVFAERRRVDITRHPPRHTPPPRPPPSPTSPPTRHDRCLSGSSQITKAPPFQSSLSSSPTHLQRQGSRNMFPRQAGRLCTRTHTHYDIAHLQTPGREHFQQRRGVKTGHSQDTATCHIDATSLHSLPPGEVLRRASHCLPVSLILFPLGCERASHKCITQADVIRAFVKIKQSEKRVGGKCSKRSFCSAEEQVHVVSQSKCLTVHGKWSAGLKQAKK